MNVSGSLLSLLTVGLLSGCLTASARPAGAQQPASACGTDAGRQTQVLDVVRDILTSPAPEPAFGGLPPDSAALVLDARVCAHAAQRINFLAGEHQRDRTVYVVRVGPVWAVHDPTFRTGEWSPLVLYDAHWKLLKVLLAM